MKRVIGVGLSLLIFVSLSYAKLARDNVAQGRQALSEERYFKALDAFRNAIKSNPNYADAYRWLGEVYFRMEEYETSLENGLKALHYSQQDRYALLLVANSYRNLGQFEDAKKYYETLIREHPSDPNVYRHYAMLNLTLNKTALAMRQLKKAQRLDPKNWRNQLSFGDYYFQMKHFDQAEKSYLRAIELNSRERTIFFKMGDFFYKRKRYADAIRILGKGESLFDNFYSGILLLGDAYFENGNFKQAVQKYNWIYEHRLSDKPEFLSSLHYKLALCYQKLNPELAVSNYQKAEKEEPKNEWIRYSFEEFVLKHYVIKQPIRKELATYHITQAQNFYEQGKLYRYFLNLKRAIYLNPFLTEPREKLIQYYRGKGELRKAYLELKSLFKVLPSTRVRDLLEKFDWQIKKGIIRIDKPEMHNFDIGLSVIAENGDEKQVLAALLDYLSDYRDRLKFHIVPDRKSTDVLTETLEFVRKKRYNFSIVVAISGGQISFNLYDKIGKAYDSLNLKSTPQSLTETLLIFFEWLETRVPRIASVDLNGSEVWVKMGRAQQVATDSRFFILDPRKSFRPLVLGKVENLEENRAQISVLSNIDPRTPIGKGQEAWLDPNIEKKGLTKLKRILLY